MIEIKVFKVKKKSALIQESKVKLVKCQTEDPKVINEEEYMSK